MGGRVSRREVVPQSEVNRDGLYKYPPQNGGSYFSSHFRLGHRKYESGDPEYFLFGDISDINYLSKKPVQFPYKQPDKEEPLHCLQALINVHKDSVRLVKSTGSDETYFAVFEFNSDVGCCISLLSSLPDSADLSTLRHAPGSGVTSSHRHLFPMGSESKFTGKDFPLIPGEMSEESLSYDPENGQDTFPLAILMETTDGNQYQSQLTLCTLDKSNDGGYTVKVLKQKLWVDGVEYLLHEMYGLENKFKPKETATNSSGEDEEEQEEGGSEGEEEEDDLGAECVVCITDVRDTLLLPCRHLCLCAACAANLRYQSNNCPICRTPFRALLQVTALHPLDPTLELDDDEVTGNPRYDMAGFEKMPLLEALNGYKLRLPSEAEEEEEEEPVQAEEGEERGEAETEEDTRVPNGSLVTAASTANTTDTIISVEEDPEIEALAKQPLATPTSHAQLAVSHQQSYGHMHIDLEQGHDIPGLVTLTDPQIGFKGSSGKKSEGNGDVVTVVVVEEVVGERVSQNESDISSCGTPNSDSSTKHLLRQH